MDEQLLAIKMLEQRLAELEGEVKHLQRTNEELRAEIAILRAENTALRTENAELRRRLGMHSRNSHKPPSTDGYRQKRVQPALPKGEKRAVGGQAGHPGHTLRAVEKPDKVVVHLPKQCSICGRAIAADEPHRVVRNRPVGDLPEPKLELTAHRLGEIECGGQAHRGEYPAYVTSAVQYGPGVRSLVTKRSVDHTMPLEPIRRLVADLYGDELNSEPVEPALEQGDELAAPLEDAVREQLKQAKPAHVDETGLRIGGNRGWLHAACNARDTHLFVHEQRGEAALRSPASVLKDVQGDAIHDRWAS